MGSKSLTAELIRRYDRPGPRYTSYPTAVEFGEEVDADAYGRHLALAASRRDDPLSLYVHLPFCEERCLYCGCNVVVTRKREVSAHYLGVLEKEIREVGRRLGERRVLRQLHWGGGTPTYSSVAQIRRLHEVIASEFSIEDDAEVAIEVDPRVTSVEQLETLRSLGFNRLSVGVQDFTPEVQEAVNRIQPYSETRQLIESARELGFGSINIDLIYGLPLQSPETFQQTLDRVVALGPNRIAVYSYAHIPWIKVQQRRIEESQLPSPDVKLELIARAIDTFGGGDYIAIGMDHFARRDDELAKALEQNTLWRNFMGYTVRNAPDTVACGMSAIGDVAGGFFQNHRKLIRYEKAIDAGRLPVARGIVLSRDDRMRRHIITTLMCSFGLEFSAVEERFEIDFADSFAPELAALKELEDDGLVKLGTDRIEVVDRGRLFVRNICMVFDSYLRRHVDAERPRFSRTV